jgi:hypothetical protein
MASKGSRYTSRQAACDSQRSGTCRHTWLRTPNVDAIGGGRSIAELDTEASGEDASSPAIGDPPAGPPSTTAASTLCPYAVHAASGVSAVSDSLTWTGSSPIVCRTSMVVLLEPCLRELKMRREAGEMRDSESVTRSADRGALFGETALSRLLSCRHQAKRQLRRDWQRHASSRSCRRMMYRGTMRHCCAFFESSPRTSLVCQDC